MPLYEYRCEGCKERIELLRNLSDPAVTECPRCGGSLKKLFSAPAIQFKGAGFYKTDYPSSSSAAPATTTPSSTAATTSTPATGSSSSDSSSSSTSSSSPATPSTSSSSGGSKSD